MTPPLATLETAPLKGLRPIRFSAVTSAPVDGTGYFDFTLAPTVDFRPSARARSEAVYVFNALSVKLGAQEFDFVASLPLVNWPTARILSMASGNAATPVIPFDIVGNSDAAPFRFAWEPSGDPDKLVLSLGGRSQQTPSMILAGVTSLTVSVVLDAYEIADSIWKEEYLKGWHDSWVSEALGSGEDGRRIRLADGPNTLRQRDY